MANVKGSLRNFDENRVESLLKSISRGIPIPVAAPANGIAESTYYDWLATGLQDLAQDLDTKCAQFAQRVRAIQQDKIDKHLTSIESKPERWQADAWLLERSYWKYYSPSAAIVDFEKRLARMEDSKLKEELQSEIKDLKSQQNSKKVIRPAG